MVLDEAQALKSSSRYVLLAFYLHVYPPNTHDSNVACKNWHYPVMYCKFPSDAYLTLGQTLIGCSALCQEY